jgi:hypothetical protein
MKINHVSITSASSLDLDFASNNPICVFYGHYSNLVLDLIREVIGDYGSIENPNRIDDGRFVVHADIEIDSKNYAACYIRNADFIGDNRLAVNFGPDSIRFSNDDTNEFVKKCNAHHINATNILVKTANIESSTDDRPIFIYEYFDRIDEAVDITPVLDRLASLGRQVFISVCSAYPEIKHEKVQIVKI